MFSAILTSIIFFLNILRYVSTAEKFLCEEFYGGRNVVQKLNSISPNTPRHRLIILNASSYGWLNFDDAVDICRLCLNATLVVQDDVTQIAQYTPTWIGVRSRLRGQTSIYQIFNLSSTAPNELCPCSNCTCPVTEWSNWSSCGLEQCTTKKVYRFRSRNESNPCPVDHLHQELIDREECTIPGCEELLAAEANDTCQPTALNHVQNTTVQPCPGFT
uniref:Uncharacterized protein n=1 Tax=Romanomermis culicivorax TaxID=13658 RepID=A0A915LCC9_ROMCU